MDVSLHVLEVLLLEVSYVLCRECCIEGRLELELEVEAVRRGYKACARRLDHDQTISRY